MSSVSSLQVHFTEGSQRVIPSSSRKRCQRDYVVGLGNLFLTDLGSVFCLDFGRASCDDLRKNLFVSLH
jgi:hypothetical protein